MTSPQGTPAFGIFLLRYGKIGFRDSFCAVVGSGACAVVGVLVGSVEVTVGVLVGAIVRADSVGAVVGVEDVANCFPVSWISVLPYGFRVSVIVCDPLWMTHVRSMGDTPFGCQ